MVQFETLSGIPRSDDHFVLIQNSFRYFDLDQVGDSDKHLSLFRMPGAFDFGPVDRQKTIHQIWELLIDVYGFDPNRLYTTYFSGDIIDRQPFPADTETALSWSEAGMPAEHIIGLPAKYNFWRQTREAVGQHTSPKRGPNTEIFFDRGPQYGCGAQCFPGCSCPRFLEFLNMLFITHSIDEFTGSVTPLAEPFTEVVIGLERVASILQRKTSVYEIDSIFPLVQQVRCFSKPMPVAFKEIPASKMERVLVDHLRGLLFLIADGAPPPGKGGRARLMRILIREMLTCKRLLGISDRGFIRSIVHTLLGYYPQLASAQQKCLEYVSQETERFERTVQTGMLALDTKIDQKNGILDWQEILEMEKETGLPSSLIKYQLWQKQVTHLSIDPHAT